MKHIIDTDELEKRIKAMKCDYSVQCFDSANEVTAYNEGVENALIILRALIASSPQADGMVVLALNNTELQKRVAVLEDLLSSAYNIAKRNGENTHWERFAGQLHVHGISPVTAKTFKILPSDTELSAYKPQADANTPPDVYDIVVDTGDGIYHTAEVVHFQQSGSKRMIQVRIGEPEPQPDDVRKDAERYQQVKDILCHYEGLSMTLEYRKGGEKYASRKVFTETEIQASPFLIENIQANAGYLWEQIKQAISKVKGTNA